MDEHTVSECAPAVPSNFRAEIMNDLLAEGYSGARLEAELRKREVQVRLSIEKMLAAAQRVARGEESYATFEEVFGSDT